MSARLKLCRSEDLERLNPMVTSFHQEMGIEMSAERRRDALLPLLRESPYGAVYLIGPDRAPVGYLIVTFSWSLEFGGMDAMLDEFWIRPPVRGRGVGSEALDGLQTALRSAGVCALSLEAKKESPAEALYARLGFERRDGYALMTHVL